MSKLVTLSIIPLMATAGFAQEKTTYAIEGTVIDNISRKPVYGVSVSIESFQKSTKTDSTGHFAFSGLSAGTYRLRFRHEDYVPMNFEGIPETSRLRTPLVITMFKAPPGTLDNMPIYNPDSTIHYKARIYDPTKPTRPDSLRHK